MKIAFFEIKGWEKRSLKKALEGHAFRFFSQPLSLENAKEIRDFGVVSVFIYSKIGPGVLKLLPKLKLITTRSTGFDHIDLKACQRKKIAVSNVPFYGENTVAEHTFALVLALSRNVHKSYVRGLRGDFSIEGLKGSDLKGKTIGVIGAGRIGLHVIRTAKGFGMEVLAYDPHQDKFLAEVLDFQYVSLEKLLKKSDIISLHVPATPETHHLINKKTIKLMKKRALLVNTARGSVVDTAALIEALDKGILAGVGLDVLEGESLIKEEKELLYEKKKVEALKQLAKDHILLAKENVVYTPHIAFYSQEALERILDTTAQNILSFVKAKPQNIVTT